MVTETLQSSAHVDAEPRGKLRRFTRGQPLSSFAQRLPPSSSQRLESLDDHQLVARLGRGGMAEIMLASRPGPAGSELVVVKRLHEEDAEDPVIVRMFVDEARLSLRLRHANIVRSDALGLVEGRHALVMEFLEGQPLQYVLKRLASLGRSMPLALFVPAFADMLEGLHYAHELCGEDGKPLNVIHRDVSPHNLFVTMSGDLKLLDFGIAKTRIQENRTRTGLLKGKVAYMAPEQAHGARIDRRADVWSAGVTLWEALAGTRLFKADNEAASLQLTLTGPIGPMSHVRADVPAELDDIVHRALVREPTARYRSAAAMAQALRVFGDERDLPVTAPLKDLMDELFGREVAEQRVRIHALLTASESVPSAPPPFSSSVPASGRRRVIVANAGVAPGADGASSAAPETLSAASDGAVITHVSSVTEFVDQLHRDQRSAFRWMSTVIAVLSVAVFALAIAFATRSRPAPSDPSPAPRAAEAPRTLEQRAPRSSLPAPAQIPGAALPALAAPQDVAPPALEPPAAPTRSAPLTARHARVERTEAVEPEPARSPSAPEPRAAASAPSPTRSAAEFGFLTLDSTPWSDVSVDGTPVGQTPVVRVKLPAGPHVLTLVNREQGLSTTYQVTIEAGKTSVRRVGLD